jgi:hypothetical protein
MQCDSSSTEPKRAVYTEVCRLIINFGNPRLSCWLPLCSTPSNQASNHGKSLTAFIQEFGNEMHRLWIATGFVNAHIKIDWIKPNTSLPIKTAFTRSL